MVRSSPGETAVSSFPVLLSGQIRGGSQRSVWAHTSRVGTPVSWQTDDRGADPSGSAPETRADDAAKDQGRSMAARPTLEPLTEIHLAHSPDSDDAFMFYALATRKLEVPGLKFQHVLADIETLNQAARQQRYDVTALSFSAYPFVAEHYILLDCGASFGEGYGPIVVAARPMKPEELKRSRVAVPGTLTTSYLVLNLYAPGVETVPVPFDRILDEVKAGAVEAGLLIHEGQLLYPQAGLHRVIDLGQWWQDETGLPLPLGANAIRRSLGAGIGRQVARAIRQSVAYALEHREEALNYALQFARDMDAELADKFVGMYVNRWTLGYGEQGRKAVRELLARGVAAGLLPGPAKADFLAEGEA
jgi:5,8-dihydroxy-2-naphthoate synthase